MTFTAQAWRRIWQHIRNERPADLPARSYFFSGIIFLLPALALSTHIGIGLIEAAVMMALLRDFRALWSSRGELFGAARWIILAFGLNLGLAAVSVTWFDSRISFLENPLRQFLMAGAIGLIALSKPKAQWFWYGLFVGTVSAAGLAIFQRFALDWERAGGFHHIIMFGDIAMAMGLMSLASIPHFRHTRLSALPYIGFLAGLTASILSGTRGGWLAMILAFIPLYLYDMPMARHKIVAGITAAVGFIVAAAYIPVFGVAQRLAIASSDIQQFEMGNTQSSIGARLEMWRGAWKMLIEHPFMGVGRANFNKGLNELIARGEISNSVKYFYHAHNEMFHALATEGILGGLVLAFVYGAPIIFFVRYLRRSDASQSYALAGLLMVLSFIGFGMTQALFSHHVGVAFYALTISVLTGICITRQEQNPSDADQVGSGR